MNILKQAPHKALLLDKKYTMDGLHRNADGYKLWVAILKNSGYLK